MAAPKYKTSDLMKLYPESDERNLHDKRIIEALKQRLNDKIHQDPESAKKAALIIENWLKKPKP